MASLRTLINNKANSLTETNLERGQIFVYTPGTEYFTSAMPFCWISPGSGNAIIEVWGASGSGSRMCCCGGGLPGNPGAYSKKCITVTGGSFVCGLVGMSCGNASQLNYRGRSESTGLCYSGSSNGCICAEGGIGGCSLCSTGTNLYCCFVALNYCNTLLAANCGIICNFGPGTTGCCAQGYGGDINCFGGVSCVNFRCTTPNGNCCFLYHVAVSPGVFARDGTWVTYSIEQDNEHSKWSGQGIASFLNALGAAGTRPTGGNPYSSCWAGISSCGCYENQGCMPYMPYGVPGLPPVPCTDVRDHGIRGGHGAVRIKYIS